MTIYWSCKWRLRQCLRNLHIFDKGSPQTNTQSNQAIIKWLLCCVWPITNWTIFCMAVLLTFVKRILVNERYATVLRWAHSSSMERKYTTWRVVGCLQSAVSGPALPWHSKVKSAYMNGQNAFNTYEAFVGYMDEETQMSNLHKPIDNSDEMNSQ